MRLLPAVCHLSLVSRKKPASPEIGMGRRGVGRGRPHQGRHEEVYRVRVFIAGATDRFCCWAAQQMRAGAHSRRRTSLRIEMIGRRRWVSVRLIGKVAAGSVGGAECCATSWAGGSTGAAPAARWIR